MTLLGSYFLDVGVDIPSRFFVAVLGDFDLSETAARNAVSRVARQGYITQTRSGRSTSYRLTTVAQRRHHRRLKQIVDFGRTTPEWDGTWSLVTFAVSEDQRQLRHQARQLLRRLGLGLLYDSVWVAPGAIDASSRAAIMDLGIERLTMFSRVREADWTAGGDPRDAFPLAEARQALDEFIAQAVFIVDGMEDDAIPPTMALRLRTEILRDWRNLGEIHPALPAELLPDDWPLARARELFVRMYDGLSEPAEERLRHHLSRTAEFDLPHVRSLSTAEVAELDLTGRDHDPLD